MKLEWFYIKCNDLYSHPPNKKLIDHLKETRNFFFNSFKYLQLDLSNELKEILFDAINIISISHDFGKSTTEFQNKIFKKPYNKKLSRHGLNSALFGFYLFEKYIDDIKKKEYSNQLVSIFRYFIFKSIRYHHGDIKRNETEVLKDSPLSYSSFQEVLDQTKNIVSSNKLAINKIYDTLLDTNGIDFIEGYESFLKEIKEGIPRKIRVSKEKLRIMNPFIFIENKNKLLFFVFNLTHSLLLESDKESAIGLENNINYLKRNLDLSWIENYKIEEGLKPDTEFNKFRKFVYEYSLDKVTKELKDNLNRKIFFLEAPTGAGKTLTMLATAMKLHDYYLKEKNQYRRIIYTMPFISIIDQNYNVLNDLFNFSKEEELDKDFLLPFHHLADKTYKDSENEYSFEEENFLVENWYSKIIITTFFQIFKSIFTNHNHLIQRYNKLINSILIIDEIQALPIRFHNIIGKTFEILIKKFNTTIIVGSATAPIILDETNIQKVDLYNNSRLEQEFGHNYKENLFHRYDLKVFKNIRISRKDLVNLIKEKETKNPTNNFGVILNTIRSSKELYLLLKDEFKEFNSIYLSTNIPPVERISRIKKINQYIEEKKQFFLVSTQLIEAGVDISLDKIFRDYSPLDSIVQTCGRVNRHNKNKSNVYIFELLDEENNNQPYSAYIYDEFLLDKTRKILSEYLDTTNDKIIPEYKLYNLSQKYFKEINNTALKDYVKKNSNNIYIPDLIKKHKHYELEENFELIEEEGLEVSIFIDDNRTYKNKKKGLSNPKELWDSFKEIYNTEKQGLERYKYQKKEFNKIKRIFYEQCITIKVRGKKATEIIKLLNKLEKFNNIYHIDEDSDYYSNELGLTLDKIKLELLK